MIHYLLDEENKMVTMFDTEMSLGPTQLILSVAEYLSIKTLPETSSLTNILNLITRFS